MADDYGIYVVSCRDLVRGVYEAGIECRNYFVAWFIVSRFASRVNRGAKFYYARNHGFGITQDVDIDFNLVVEVAAYRRGCEGRRDGSWGVDCFFRLVGSSFIIILGGFRNILRSDRQ